MLKGIRLHLLIVLKLIRLNMLTKMRHKVLLSHQGKGLTGIGIGVIRQGMKAVRIMVKILWIRFMIEVF